MGPQIGNQDIFEGIYTEKFRSLARPFGEFVSYERDRAALDIGLHLIEPVNRQFTVSNTRVWFQLKGIRSSTLTSDNFTTFSEVPLDLEIEKLRFWYASPEAIYLVVYIECADIFLAEDVRDIVDRQWGESVLHPQTFRKGQKTARVRISKSAQLNDDLWRRMLSHRSLRIDGPSFRGHPLGHRLDPLRCIPKKMDPSVFLEVVGRLLSVHRYEIEKELDVTHLFPDSQSSGDILSLTYGIIYYTYEWVLQIMTAFGVGPNSDFKTEGEVFHVQGPCAVLVHSNKVSYPDNRALERLTRELIEAKNIRQLLVFVNGYNDPAYFGAFFGSVRGTGLECMPQNLGDLAFNLLTATTVYLDFRDRISWKTVNYLY